MELKGIQDERLEKMSVLVKMMEKRNSCATNPNT